MEEKIKTCKKCGSKMEEAHRKAPKYGEKCAPSGTSWTDVSSTSSSSPVIVAGAITLKAPIRIKRFICTNPNCRWEDQEREIDARK